MLWSWLRLKLGIILDHTLTTLKIAYTIEKSNKDYFNAKENPIYKNNYGQKIFDVAIQLYNNEIKRTINTIITF